MLFNTLQFVIFFIVITILYYVLPKKACPVLLLIASYIFYMGWNVKYSLLLFASTFITYIAAICMDRFGDTVPKRRLFLVIAIASNLSILFFFKYMTMFVSNWSIVLPVGISFYILQAIGYTIDVYRKDIPVEKNFVYYALFVSFFPQLVAGPIERASNMLPQIRSITTNRKFVPDNFVRGVILILWGLFIKMVIADRIATFVDTAFNYYYMYGTVELFVGAFAFIIQIYGDFAGYSMVAIGAAKVLGFSLMSNFDSPFFAVSITDLWRRWHRSLGFWFRDYLYIPMGGSRRGKVRHYINIMVTFLLSGLWHGAELSFVLWGGLQGFFQVLEGILKKPVQKFYEKHNVDTQSFSHRLLMMIKTFVIFFLTAIPFRAATIKDAIAYVTQMITHYDPWAIYDGSMYEMGLSLPQIHILVFAVALLMFVDYINYSRKKMLDEWLMEQGAWLRYTFIIGLFLAVWVWGSYGPYFNGQAFIYFQF